jgi:hypothetical protein
MCYWYNYNGQIKDMACRTFLLKLGQRGYLTLPVRRRPGGSSYQQLIPKVPHSTDLIFGKLKSVAPVTIKQVDKTCLENPTPVSALSCLAYKIPFLLAL